MVDDRLTCFISVYRKHDDPRVSRDRATSHDPAHGGYCVGVATPKYLFPIFENFPSSVFLCSTRDKAVSRSPLNIEYNENTCVILATDLLLSCP